MAKLLILGRKKDNPAEFGSAELMAQKLNQLGSKHQIVSLEYDELGFDLDGQADVWDIRHNVSLKSYDFVFVRDWFLDEIERVLTLSMWLKSEHIPFLNTESLKNRSFSKLSQIMHMTLEGIPTTPTLNGTPEFVFWRIKEKQWRYPLIVKKRGSSRGRDNFQVDSEAELSKIIDEYAKRGLAWKMLVQQFVPNDGDYRLVTYKGDFKLVIFRKRLGDHTHLNNTSQGGKATLVELSDLQKLPYYEDLKRSATILCERWGRDFTGVDAILNDDSYTILEINNMPQIETGSFINEKLNVLLEIIEQEIQEKTS